MLSAASFAESDGTVINNEGRAQAFLPGLRSGVLRQHTIMLESWRWLYSLHSTVQNREVDWTQFDHVIDAVVAAMPELPVLRMLRRMPPSAFVDKNWRVSRTVTVVVRRCARTSAFMNRVSRRTKDTMFAFSMEGNNQPSAPRSQIPFAWARAELSTGVEQVPG